MNYIKNIWFFIDKLGIYITPFMWIFSYKFLYIYLFVILSWYLNNNKCLISQLEYYIWGETFMGNDKYYVPKSNRYLLYLNFIIAIYSYKNIIFDSIYHLHKYL